MKVYNVHSLQSTVYGSLPIAIGITDYSLRSSVFCLQPSLPTAYCCCLLLLPTVDHGLLTIGLLMHQVCVSCQRTHGQDKAEDGENSTG
jgi:hypothetical protein